MAGRLLGPWLCVLLAAMALAGCLRSTPQAAETDSSSAGSASLPLASGSPSPSPGPTAQVVVTMELDRTSIKPGEVISIRLKAANPGPGPAPVSDWCSPPWIVKLSGPDPNSTYAQEPRRYCPSRGMTSGEMPPTWEMEAGAADWLNLTWDGRLPGFQPLAFRNDAVPGPYVVTAGYDGAPQAAANVTVLPVPAMLVWFGNATAPHGEDVTVHAAFSNPTDETVFYAVDCAGAPWDAMATTIGPDADGDYMTLGAVEATPPPCGEDPGRLDPGQEVEQAFRWNGTLRDSATGHWYQPDWDVYVQVSAAYGLSPDAAAERSVAAWAHVYVCGSSRAPCG